MEGLLETQRVYKELGSVPELVNLIDNPPVFLLQTDLKCRLFNRKEPPVSCRAYIFDRAFILARDNCTNDASDIKEPVVFADVPKKNDKDSKTDDNLVTSFKKGAEDVQRELYKKQEETDQQENQRNAKFCLEFYACLGQTFPALFFHKSDNAYCAKFTQISNREGLEEDAIVVDEVDIWVEKEFEAEITLILGMLQQNMIRLFRIPQSKGAVDRSMHRSMKNRTRSRSSRTTARGSKSPEYIKSQLRKNTSNKDRPGPGVKLSGLSEVNSAEFDETGEFAVIFGEKAAFKGFSINDKCIVSEVIPWGLADAAGVCVGDKVELIKGSEPNPDEFEFLDFPERIEIVFSRTIEADNKQSKRRDMFKSDGSSRLSIDREAEQMVELFLIKKQRKKTLPAFESSDDEESEPEQTNEFKVAIKKGKQRRLNDKGKIWGRLQRGYKIDMSATRSDLEEKIFEDEKEHVEKLLKGLIDSLETKKEKNCVRALQEIYTTEVKYLENLNLLVEARLFIAKITRPLTCKETKSGRIFCEHKKVRKLCTQQSKQTAQAVPNDDLDKVFLNVKSIISVHTQIESGLRKEMCKLYQKRLQRETVSVEDLLAVFCGEFTKVAPYLSMYTNYIQRYSYAVEFQKTLRQDNTHFNMGIRKVEEENSIRFMSLINKPLQRVTKYPLLFSSLEGYVKKFIVQEEKSEVSPEDKKKFAAMAFALAGASKVVKAVVDKVNVKVGKARDLEEMSRIYEEVGGKNKIKDLLQPWRRFKGEFIAFKLIFGSEADYPEEYEDCVVFVFNDMLVAAVQLGMLHRRDSNASQGLSSVARRAGGKIGSTLSRSSMRLLSSAAATATKTGSRLTRFGRSKSTRNNKNKKKNTLRGPPKKELGLNHYSRNKTLGKNSRPQKFGLNKTRPFNGSKRHNSKSSAGSSRLQSTKRVSKNTGEQESKLRNLNPVQQIAIDKLGRIPTYENIIEDDEEIFSVSYEYDAEEPVDENASYPEDLKLKMIFKSEGDQKKIGALISSIQEEINEKHKNWEKVREKEELRAIKPNKNIAEAL